MGIVGKILNMGISRVSEKAFLRLCVAFAVVLSLVVTYLTTATFPASYAAEDSQPVEPIPPKYETIITPLSNIFNFNSDLTNYCSGSDFIENNAANLDYDFNNCGTMQDYYDASIRMLKNYNIVSKGMNSEDVEREHASLNELYSNTGINLNALVSRKDNPTDPTYKNDSELSYEDINDDIIREKTKDGYEIQDTLLLFNMISTETSYTMFKDLLQRVNDEKYKMVELARADHRNENVNRTVWEYDSWFYNCHAEAVAVVNGQDGYCIDLYANYLLATSNNRALIDSLLNVSSSGVNVDELRADKAHQVAQYMKNAENQYWTLSMKLAYATEDYKNFSEAKPILMNAFGDKFYSIEHMSDNEISILSKVGYSAAALTTLRDTVTNLPKIPTSTNHTVATSSDDNTPMVNLKQGDCALAYNVVPTGPIDSRCIGKKTDEKFKALELTGSGTTADRKDANVTLFNPNEEYDSDDLGSVVRRNGEGLNAKSLKFDAGSDKDSNGNAAMKQLQDIQMNYTKLPVYLQNSGITYRYQVQDGGHAIHAIDQDARSSVRTWIYNGEQSMDIDPVSINTKNTSGGDGGLSLAMDTQVFWFDKDRNLIYKSPSRNYGYWGASRTDTQPFINSIAYFAMAGRNGAFSGSLCKSAKGSDGKELSGGNRPRGFECDHQDPVTVYADFDGGTTIETRLVPFHQGANYRVSLAGPISTGNFSVGIVKPGEGYAIKGRVAPTLTLSISDACGPAAMWYKAYDSNYQPIGDSKYDRLDISNVSCTDYRATYVELPMNAEYIRVWTRSGQGWGINFNQDEWCSGSWDNRGKNESRYGSSSSENNRIVYDGLCSSVPGNYVDNDINGTRIKWTHKKDKFPETYDYIKVTPTLEVHTDDSDGGSWASIGSFDWEGYDMDSRAAEPHDPIIGFAACTYGALGALFAPSYEVNDGSGQSSGKVTGQDCQYATLPRDTDKNEQRYANSLTINFLPRQYFEYRVAQNDTWSDPITQLDASGNEASTGINTITIGNPSATAQPLQNFTTGMSKADEDMLKNDDGSGFYYDAFHTLHSYYKAEGDEYHKDGVNDIYPQAQFSNTGLNFERGKDGGNNYLTSRTRITTPALTDSYFNETDYFRYTSSGNLSVQESHLAQVGNDSNTCSENLQGCNVAFANSKYPIKIWKRYHDSVWSSEGDDGSNDSVSGQHYLTFQNYVCHEDSIHTSRSYDECSKADAEKATADMLDDAYRVNFDPYLKPVLGYQFYNGNRIRYSSSDPSGLGGGGKTITVNDLTRHHQTPENLSLMNRDATMTRISLVLSGIFADNFSIYYRAYQCSDSKKATSCAWSEVAHDGNFSGDGVSPVLAIQTYMTPKSFVKNEILAVRTVALTYAESAPALVKLRAYYTDSSFAKWTEVNCTDVITEIVGNYYDKISNCNSEIPAKSYVKFAYAKYSGSAVGYPAPSNADAYSKLIYYDPASTIGVSMFYNGDIMSEMSVSADVTDGQFKKDFNHFVAIMSRNIWLTVLTIAVMIVGIFLGGYAILAELEPVVAVIIFCIGLAIDLLSLLPTILLAGEYVTASKVTDKNIPDSYREHNSWDPEHNLPQASKFIWVNSGYFAEAKSGDIYMHYEFERIDLHGNKQHESGGRIPIYPKRSPEGTYFESRISNYMIPVKDQIDPSCTSHCATNDYEIYIPDGAQVWFEIDGDVKANEKYILHNNSDISVGYMSTGLQGNRHHDRYVYASSWAAMTYMKQLATQADEHKQETDMNIGYATAMTIVSIIAFTAAVVGPKCLGSGVSESVTSVGSGEPGTVMVESPPRGRVVQGEPYATEQNPLFNTDDALGVSRSEAFETDNYSYYSSGEAAQHDAVAPLPQGLEGSPPSLTHRFNPGFRRAQVAADGHDGIVGIVRMVRSRFGNDPVASEAVVDEVGYVASRTSADTPLGETRALIQGRVRAVEGELRDLQAQSLQFPDDATIPPKIRAKNAQHKFLKALQRALRLAADTEMQGDNHQGLFSQDVNGFQTRGYDNFRDFLTEVTEAIHNPNGQAMNRLATRGILSDNANFNGRVLHELGIDNERVNAAHDIDQVVDIFFEGGVLKRAGDMNAGAFAERLVMNHLGSALRNRLGLSTIGVNYRNDVANLNAELDGLVVEGLPGGGCVFSCARNNGSSTNTSQESTGDSPEQWLGADGFDNDPIQDAWMQGLAPQQRTRELTGSDLSGVEDSDLSVSSGPETGSETGPETGPGAAPLTEAQRQAQIQAEVARQADATFGQQQGAGTKVEGGAAGSENESAPASPDPSGRPSNADEMAPPIPEETVLERVQARVNERETWIDTLSRWLREFCSGFGRGEASSSGEELSSGISAASNSTEESTVRQGLTLRRSKLVKSLIVGGDLVALGGTVASYYQYAMTRPFEIMLKRQLFYAGTTANTYQEVLCFIFGVDSQHYNEINGENQTSDCMNRSLVAVPGGTAQPPTPASPPEGGQSNNFGAPLEYSQPSDFETEPAPLSTSSSKERPERGGDYEITDPDTSKHGSSADAGSNTDGSSADAGSNTDGNSADAGSITDCKLDENGDLLDSSPEACKWTEQFSLDSMELRILDIYDCLLFISEAEIPWDYPTQADRPPTRENCIQKLFDGYKLSDATGLIASERLVFGATPQTPLNAHPILHGVKSLQEETEQIHACLGDGSLLEYDPKCLNLSDSVAQRLSYLLDPFNISKLSEVIKKILTPGVGPDYLSAMHEDNPTYQTILKMLNSEEEHSDEYLNFWNNALKSLDDAERTSMVKYALSYYFREFSLNYQWTALSNDQEVDIIDNIVNQGENLTVEQIATQLNGYLHNYATDILPNAYTQGFSLSFDRFMSDTGDTDDYYRGIISSNQGVGIMSTGHNLEALPTRNTDCAPVNYDANPNRPLTPATSEGVETDDIVCAYNVEELYNAGVDLIIEDDLYAAVQATYDDGYTPKLQFVKKIYINGNSYSVLRGGSEFIGHNEVAQPDGSIKDNGNYIDFVDSKHNPTLQLLLFGNANMSGLYRNDVQLNIDNKYDMPVVDLLTHKYPDIINIDAIKNTNLSFDCDTSNGIVYYNQEVNCSVNVNSSAKFDADNARIVSDQPLVVTVAFPQGFGFTTNFTGNFNIDEVVTEKEDTVVDNEEYVKFTLPAGSYVFDADNKLAFKLAPKVHHSSSIIYATVNDSNPIFANSLAQSIILGSNDEVGDVQCDHLSYEDLDNVKNGNYSSVIGSEMRVSDKSLKKCYVANFTNYPQRFRVGLTDDGDNSDANALTISSDIVVQPRSFASFNMTKEILDYLKGTLKESGVDTSYICPVGQFIHDGGVGQDINGNHSYTCVDADGQFAGSFAVQKQVTRYVSNANFTLDIFRATSKAYTCQDGDQLVDSLDGIDPNKLPPGAYSVIDISQYGCKAPVIDATGEIVPNEFNYFGYMGERPTGDTYIEAEAYDEYSCPEGGQVLDWGSTMVCMNYVTGSHRDAEVTHHDAVTKPIINHFVQEIPIEPGFYSVQTVFVVDKSYSYEKIVDSPGYDEYSCPEGGQVLEWGSVMVCMNYVTGSHRDAERKHQDEVAHWIKHDIISHPEQRDIEPTRFSEFVW